MIQNVYQYQEDMKKQGVYFSVTGPFSHILMEGIADTLRQKMKRERIKKTVMMNVFSVVVEMVQNIIRYSAETIPGDIVAEEYPEIRIGTLIIGCKDNQYYVISGNCVKNSDIEPLREKLTLLCNMTKEELKAHYREVRKTGRFLNGRAGLGLIEMGRKANKPIEFSFDQIDDRISFFSISVII